MDVRTNSYARSRSRKSHMKSRFGCVTCKRRRVKCDETRPECTNCVRHSVECQYSSASGRATPADPSELPSLEPPGLDKEDKKSEYAFISSFQPRFNIPKRPHREARTGPAQLSSSSHVEAALIQRPFQFTANDMALFHHCMSTEELKSHLPDELVRLGFSVHYVLHLLLALSGFHLRRKPESNRIQQFLGQEFDSLVEAERHLNTAISQLAAVDPLLHGENGHIVYIASLFIFICSLARGPQPGEYLAFRDDNDIPGLSLFMSMRSILEANNNLSTSKAISEVQPQQQQNINLQEHEPEPGNSLSGYNGLKQNSKISKDHYSQSLNELRILIENTFPSTDARYSAFIRALELLWSRYELIIDATNPILSSELWPQIFSWLYLLPNIVSLEMQQRHPVALVLFSYFAVLLQELDSVWFIQGWSSHIVRRISNDLDKFHSPFLSWPRMRLLLV